MQARIARLVLIVQNVLRARGALALLALQRRALILVEKSAGETALVQMKNFLQLIRICAALERAQLICALKWNAKIIRSARTANAFFLIAKRILMV